MSKTTIDRLPTPDKVHGTIRQHMIGDGFSIVFDLERSEGSWIVDAQTGEKYLDFYSFFASLPLGFNHPAFHTPENQERLLRAAIHKPSNSDAHSAELAGFVQAFSQSAMPEPFKHLFFIEGGALAVENALKTAFDWKVRKNLDAGRAPLGSKIVHFRQAFHGRSGYTLSLTNTLPIKTEHFPQFDWPRIDNPHVRFPIDAEETERVAVCEARAVEQIHNAFDEHPHDIAAIIIETIQGEGGDHHFRREFFEQLREIADRKEACLIFDEVQTGFGVTGRFWAFEHLGVTPDIVCFGKKSQVCGIMASDRLDEVEDNVFSMSSRINSTWGGGLVDMVRCQIVLETMESENLVDNAAQVGETLLGGLETLARDFPHAIDNVRGRGLFCAFDCPDNGTRDALLQTALDHRVLLLACGASSVRLRPALTLRSSEAVEGVARIRKCVESL